MLLMWRNDKLYCLYHHKLRHGKSNIQGEGFRYLKIKFNETYLLSEGYERDETTNTVTKHLTLHELELYSDKD